MKLAKRVIDARTKGRAACGIAFISFGDIVKDLLKQDADFGARYGKSVSQGNLVDDPMVNAIFSRHIEGLRASEDPRLCIVDGFPRSSAQIGFAANNGFLTKESKVFMLDASIATCAERFTHRKQNMPGRIDAELETFHKRYHLHIDMARDLRNMFKETDCRLIDIDANRDTPSQVFPEIFGNLLDDVAWALHAADRKAESANA